MNQPDFYQLRADFPMLNKTMHGKPLIYLDSAATSQKPLQVIDAMNQFYREQYSTVHRAVYELAAKATLQYQNVRQQVKNFLNASKEEEIIFTRGTTESINLVAYSFGKAFIQPGDEIIISALEHHSNIVPWQILCEDRGAVLKVIPINERGELILEEYEKLLSDRTRLVAVAHISNSLGTVNPIKEITKLAHQRGAKILVDGAQSAPHLSVDVHDLDVDFFVFSVHKTLGPTGLGVLYGKKDLLDQMPPYQGGGDMIETVTFSKTTYQPLPLKFEAGTPLIAEVIGLGAALKYIQTIGLSSIEKWEQHLTSYARDRLEEIQGLRIIGTSNKKGALISFAIEGIHALDIGTMLDLQGVAIRTGHHCAQPVLQYFNLPSMARISFGLYNTPEEVDHFIESLKGVIRLLK